MVRRLLKSQHARVSEWRAAISRVRAAYELHHKRKPNLAAPRRFTEKIQWRKLFDMNPVFAVLSDKLAVRTFIAERVGADCLIPLLWSGVAEDIPFAKIRPPYVLKSTHASGHYALIDANGDSEAQQTELRLRAASWLAQPFGITQDEPGYVPVPPMLMVEETIRTDDGERPEEVRLFVFNGKVGVINTVFVEDGLIRNGAFHTRDWVKLDWHFTRALDRMFLRPKRLDDMIRMAERLGHDLDHVRVDFYDCGERIYIGELTLYSWSGMSPFNPDQADLALGDCWSLRHPMRRAILGVLFGRRQIARPERTLSGD